MALFGENEGRLTLGGTGDRDDGIVLARGGGISLKKVSSPVFYVLTGTLCLWVFVYISGIFPYLGRAGDENYSSTGTSTSLGKYDFGLTTMFLVKGQTAFFEYESRSAEGAITLDVKPVTVFGYSDRVQRISGKQDGVAEFPIEATGLYVFEHEPALGRRYGRTSYSVSWGAR